jgi:PASTA domain
MDPRHIRLLEAEGFPAGHRALEISRGVGCHSETISTLPVDALEGGLIVAGPARQRCRTGKSSPFTYAGVAEAIPSGYPDSPGCQDNLTGEACNSVDMTTFDDGQSAWRRLATWIRQVKPDGDLALTMLSDVGQIRRLLDHAEFEAVRVARSQRRSWSEIAMRLGMTRQSAWERWRDIDDAPDPSEDWSSSADPVELALTARDRRRRSTVAVPNVVGLSWNDARERLMVNGLVITSPDPDGPPLTADGWPAGVVTDQSPESGATIPPGSLVTVWLNRGRGGGSGVREPLRPKPAPQAGRAVPDEATG